MTGLSVVNLVADGLHNPVLTTLTPFGQFVLLVLVQIGGLGIMTLSAAVVIVLGGRIGPRTHQALQSSVEEEHRRHLERSLRKIFQMTVIIELIGAALLFVRFYPAMGDAGLAAWHSVFLSVSAFNNAGFALFSDNLISYQSDLLVNLVVMGLITAGGLGFLVIATVTRWKTYRNSAESTWNRFPPQVRVVVTFSTLLTLAGTVLSPAVVTPDPAAATSALDAGTLATSQPVAAAAQPVPPEAVDSATDNDASVATKQSERGRLAPLPEFSAAHVIVNLLTTVKVRTLEQLPGVGRPERRPRR